MDTASIRKQFEERSKTGSPETKPKPRIPLRTQTLDSQTSLTRFKPKKPERSQSIANKIQAQSSVNSQINNKQTPRVSSQANDEQICSDLQDLDDIMSSLQMLTGNEDEQIIERSSVTTKEDEKIDVINLEKIENKIIIDEIHLGKTEILNNVEDCNTNVVVDPKEKDWMKQGDTKENTGMDKCEKGSEDVIAVPVMLRETTDQKKFAINGKDTDRDTITNGMGDDNVEKMLEGIRKKLETANDFETLKEGCLQSFISITETIQVMETKIQDIQEMNDRPQEMPGFLSPPTSTSLPPPPPPPGPPSDLFNTPKKLIIKKNSGERSKPPSEESVASGNFLMEEIVRKQMSRNNRDSLRKKYNELK